MEHLRVIDSQGAVTTFAVRSVKGSREHVFELLGDSGRPTTRRVHVTTDGHDVWREYDSLSIDDDGVVHAMMFFAGEKTAVLGAKDNSQEHLDITVDSDITTA